MGQGLRQPGLIQKLPYVDERGNKALYRCDLAVGLTMMNRAFFVDILGVDFTINNVGLVGVGGAGGDGGGGGGGVVIYDETKCLKGSYFHATMNKDIHKWMAASKQYPFLCYLFMTEGLVIVQFSNHFRHGFMNVLKIFLWCKLKSANIWSDEEYCIQSFKRNQKYIDQDQAVQLYANLDANYFQSHSKHIFNDEQGRVMIDLTIEKGIYHLYFIIYITLLIYFIDILFLYIIYYIEKIIYIREDNTGMRMLKAGKKSWEYIITKVEYCQKYDIVGMNIFMYPLPSIDKTVILKMAEGKSIFITSFY